MKSKDSKHIFSMPFSSAFRHILTGQWLYSMFQTKEEMGRLRKRWEDDIIAGSTFLEAYRNAEDRNRWAEFVHGANILLDTVQR